MSAPLSPGVGEVVEVLPDDETKTGEPDVAHIVKSGEQTGAAAKVIEARVYGTPVEALCGAVFVPKRDPTRLPLCAACKDIYDTYRVFEGDLPETPGA